MEAAASQLRKAVDKPPETPPKKVPSSSRGDGKYQNYLSKFAKPGQSDLKNNAEAKTRTALPSVKKEERNPRVTERGSNAAASSNVLSKEQQAR